jgi:hypothetical protein
VEFIDMAQGRDEWKALVNMVMNLWFPYKGRKVDD